ncbi:S41 family peptidase [Pedobacter arcticus]|uniref:S41 family peptidase n=1 Tax=Pedobacter arcticus TaxID=752140 RepID=UPI0002F1CB14|nr:S41 family peptidase [Pedobacter arcticus]
MNNISLALRLAVFGAFALVACKKDKALPKEAGPTPTTNRNELSKDSMFLYAKEVYLWNDALPAYGVFDPRSKFNGSSDHFTNLNAELFALTRYGINPLTALPYEYNPEEKDQTKYSFIEDLVAEGKLAVLKNSKSNIDFNGDGDDLGFSLALTGYRDNYRIYLRFSSPGSPAALAGLDRGDYINNINNKSIGTDFDSEESYINDAINKSTIKISGKKRNGTSFNVTLNKTKYNSSPIFKDTVLVTGGKKIGYLAYARFTDDENSFAPLTAVFAKFSAAGVSDLVIDLRYNPGGYVNTAEHLINLIAPSSLDGKTMFEQTYNATMEAGKATILKNQPLRDQQGKILYDNGRMLTYADESFKKADNKTVFSKEGALDNISKVVFITTEGTASSSELVINSLKPHITVKTVGSTSYGKPVGFFPIRIDKYDLYLSSFFTTNANGEGNYFAGITPDAVREDDVEKGFGDPNEESLSSAISFLTVGKFTTSTSTKKVNSESTKASSSAVLKVYGPAVLKGMIETPKVRR